MGRWFWIGCSFRRVQRESTEAGKSDTYPKGRHPVFGSHSHFYFNITRQYCISVFITSVRCSCSCLASQGRDGCWRKGTTRPQLFHGPAEGSQNDRSCRWNFATSLCTTLRSAVSCLSSLLWRSSIVGDVFLLVPAFIGQLSFCLWLIVKGVTFASGRKSKSWRGKAGAWRVVTRATFTRVSAN